MITATAEDSEGTRIIIGAETEEKLESIRDSLEKVTDFSFKMEGAPEKLLEIDGINEQYIRSAREPENCMNYHIRKGLSKLGRDSFIDWWTLTEPEERETIRKRFLERLEEYTDRVEEKADIEPFLEKQFPMVGRHGLQKLLGDEIWEIKKEERGSLNEHSNRALENGENGKKFEELFRDLCRDEGMGCYRDTAEALKEYFPEVYREIRKELGTMRGIPDFLVDKKNSKSLNNWIETAERFWEPESRFAFVEVKYNGSRLSKHQKKMVKLLKEHGIETAVFRGTFNSFRVEPT